MEDACMDEVRWGRGGLLRDVNENENERGIDERIIVLQVKDFGQECGLRNE